MSPTAILTTLTPDTANPTPNPTASSPGTPHPTGISVANDSYCGMSWFDARKCGVPCPSGNSTACSLDEHCYADVVCTGTLNPTNAPLVYGNYCGMTWSDAGKCGIPCPSGNSSVCSLEEHCYADVACDAIAL